MSKSRRKAQQARPAAASRPPGLLAHESTHSVERGAVGSAKADGSLPPILAAVSESEIAAIAARRLGGDYTETPDELDQRR